MSRRRLAVCLAATVAVTVLGNGCGHGGPSGIGADPDGSADQATSSAPTKTRADALAQAVNLRASDFPYLESQGPSEPPSAADRKSEREFDRCVGGRDLESHLAEADSPRFDGTVAAELQEFSSSASVYPSVAAAARVGAALRSRRVFACLSRLLKPTLEAQEGGGDYEIVSVRTERLPTPAPSVPGSFGFRIRATVAAAPETRQLTAFSETAGPAVAPQATAFIDILAFISGPIEVDLTATGAPAPISHGLEKQLLLLLHARAEASS